MLLKSRADGSRSRGLGSKLGVKKECFGSAGLPSSPRAPRRPLPVLTEPGGSLESPSRHTGSTASPAVLHRVPAVHGALQPPEPLQPSPVWGQDGKIWGRCVGPVGRVPLPPGRCLAVGQSRDHSGLRGGLPPSRAFPFFALFFPVPSPKGMGGGDSEGPGGGRFPSQLSVPKARFLLKEGDAQKKEKHISSPPKKTFRLLPRLLPLLPPRDEAGDEGGTPSLQWGGSRGDAQRCGAGGTGLGA